MDRYEYKNQLETLQKLSHIGLWEYDLKTNVLSWTDEVYNIFELDKNIFTPTYDNFLDKVGYRPTKGFFFQQYLN